MQRSSNRNPCPCCGRTKTSHCAWTLNGTEEDTILCHAGERWGPPPGLAIGDVIDIEGRQWALTATDKGFAGSSHVFRPHRNNNFKSFRLSPAVRSGNAKLLAVEPLHGLSPFEIWSRLRLDARLAFDPALPQDDLIGTLEQLFDRCKHLLVKLRRGVKSDHTLQPHVDEATSLLRQLRYELQHLKRCVIDPSYAAAWEDLPPLQLLEEDSDWAYWNHQKAPSTHPWVIECRAAGEPFWFPVEASA